MPQPPEPINVDAAMLSFQYPWLLVLLPLAIWSAWRWFGQRRWAIRFPSGLLFQGVPTGRASWAIRGGGWLRGVGLALLILTLAGPRWPDPGSRITTRGLSLAMVVDNSRSMENEDFLWENQPIRRLDGVKKVFRWFVEGGQGPGGVSLPGRPQDLISLITFATRPVTACPLTLDHGNLLFILEHVEPRALNIDATSNPGDALAWALHGLQKAPTERKVIVLLTDGEANVPPPALTPLQAGQLAGNLKVPIYTIDINGETGPEADRARETLQKVAQMSGGAYFHAADGPALARVYSDVDRMERGRIESFEYRVYRPLFLPFALAALGCWGLVLGLETSRWRRGP